MATFSKDLVKKYAEQIKCQYLNIRADDGIEFAYPNLYCELLDIIKNNAVKFEHHHVPGTHHVHLQDPQAVSKIISNFLTPPYYDISNNFEDLVI